MKILEIYIFEKYIFFSSHFILFLQTYKFVTELDPDREVCDHWNPCQIGYIYSLPSPDQALLANELWREYIKKFKHFVIFTAMNRDIFIYIT